MTDKTILGFIAILTGTFVVLRLTGITDWSWFWVLSPLWVAATVAVAALLVLVTAFRVIGHLEARRSDDE